MLPADVAQAQATQFVVGHATRQRFGGLAEQIPRRAPENQVALLQVGVHEITQQRKQVWLALDLVDDDQPGQRLQRQLRLRQQGGVTGILQVEDVIRGKLAGQSGFAGLARPQNGRHGKGGHEVGDRGSVGRSVDHAHEG